MDGEQEKPAEPIKVVKKKTAISKKAILLVVAVAILVALLVLGLNRMGKDEKQAESKRVCGDHLIQEALPYLSSRDAQRLHPIVENIRKQPDYDKEPDCLYLALSSSLSRSDATQAAEDLSKLEKVYDPNVGFSKAFGLKLRTMEGLREAVNALNQRNEEYKQNAKILNGIKS